jgi:hypothetical protein
MAGVTFLPCDCGWISGFEFEQQLVVLSIPYPHIVSAFFAKLPRSLFSCRVVARSCEFDIHFLYGVWRRHKHCLLIEGGRICTYEDWEEGM